MARKSWDEYFMQVAKDIAERSTCPRAHIGAVIVKDNRILATGYNGALAGTKHCTEVGCKMVQGHCMRAVHAETNAIAQAAKFGVSVDGATLYCWGYRFSPAVDDNGLEVESTIGEGVAFCENCNLLMRAAGIHRMVTNEK